MLIPFPITNAAPDVLFLVKYESQDTNLSRKKDPKKVLSEFLRFDPLAPVRASDKAMQQVLCKNQLSLSSGSVNFSLTVSQSPNFGYLPSQPPSSATSFTVLWPKSPLRSVSARAPQFAEDIHNGTLRTYAYLETLSCGHQVWNQLETSFDETGHLVEGKLAKRRRCHECAELAKAKKLPESAGGKKRGVA